MLKLVHKNFVSQTWNLVSGFIGDALNYSDDYSLDQVKVYLTSGQWQLIVALDDLGKIKGCCTVSFLNYPNDRVAFITTIGGKFISDKEIYREFTELLKTQGATKVQGAARESIARLWRRLGFTEKYVIVENKL
jgi:hypothetical protein